MGMNVGGAKGKISPQMNVTPLVDVVLVLLIIFMVVTPLLTKKFWLHVPKKAEDTQEPPPENSVPPIMLTYAANDIIRINGQEVARTELHDKLARALAARSDGLIFFDAEDDADYGRAVELMDLSRGAGASTIAIVPQE